MMRLLDIVRIIAPKGRQGSDPGRKRDGTKKARAEGQGRGAQQYRAQQLVLWSCLNRQLIANLGKTYRALRPLFFKNDFVAHA
jgi:hypothetical protein